VAAKVGTAVGTFERGHHKATVWQAEIAVSFAAHLGLSLRSHMAGPQVAVMARQWAMGAGIRGRISSIWVPMKKLASAVLGEKAVRTVRMVAQQQGTAQVVAGKALRCIKMMVSHVEGMDLVAS
jgi:hypothetical protein